MKCDTHYNMDEPWELYFKGKKMNIEAHVLWFRLYEMSRLGKSIEIGSQLGAEGRREWEVTTNGYRALFGVMKMFWN